jgi:FixJ family two-component response regulator
MVMRTSQTAPDGAKSRGRHRPGGGWSSNSGPARQEAAMSPKANHPDSSVNDAPVIHIIDDDESMRLALGTLLRSVALANQLHSSVDAFLNASRPNVPGCLILDIRLPGISGLDFQVQLAQLGIRLPVILITGHGDVPMSVRGMKAGAIDFLIKPFRDQDMLDAIYTAVGRDRIRRMADAESASMRERFELLSPRERQVMQLVSAGKMNKQVAATLGVSEITVKIHRGSVMRKMGARTLADLVRLAEALGLAR